MTGEERVDGQTLAKGLDGTEDANRLAGLDIDTFFMNGDGVGFFLRLCGQNRQMQLYGSLFAVWRQL